MKTLVNNLVLFFSVFAIMCVISGCDTESADANNVVITPRDISLAKGESVTLMASGGYDYRWSLEGSDASSWGTLSTVSGPSTVYTSLRNSDSNGLPSVRVVKVSSYIEGSGSASNVTESSYSQIHTAEAYISHIAEPEAVPSSLRISPSSVSVSANGIISFTASGGEGSYSWLLSDTSYGSLTIASGDETVYAANSSNVSATVILTVTSGSDNEAAIITHTP